MTLRLRHDPKQVRDHARNLAAGSAAIARGVPQDDAMRYYRFLASIELKMHQALVEVRCPQRGHLLAAAYRTPWGNLVVSQIHLSPAARSRLGGIGNPWAESQPFRYLLSDAANGDFMPVDPVCHCDRHRIRHDRMNRAAANALQTGKTQVVHPVDGFLGSVWIEKIGTFDKEELSAIHASAAEWDGMLTVTQSDPPDRHVAMMLVEISGPADMFEEQRSAFVLAIRARLPIGTIAHVR